jgi:predicted AAA+ superfamily ATPase
LAGRVAVLELLPFSFSELEQADQLPGSIEECMFTGAYPRIYDMNLEPSMWYSNYVATYLERDVRRIKNVTDLSAFQHFLKMCAARSGQILNLSSLGNDCGISHNTAKAWLSILQAGYIVYLLRPHFQNFNKRLIKSSKLYFYDTGLLSHLLGIASPEMLNIHSHRGALFETWVISELLKGRRNRALNENIYYWRDNVGHEIDCIAEKSDKLLPLEIKSGKTIASDFFKGLNFYTALSQDIAVQPTVVYAGSMDQQRKDGNVLSWKSFGRSMPEEI